MTPDTVSDERLSDWDLAALIKVWEVNPHFPLFRKEVLMSLRELQRRRATPPDRAAVVEAEAMCLAESMAGADQDKRPWMLGYRAGAAACWNKLRSLSHKDKDNG